MRLTAMTDYSLRSLMYVALRPGRLCTITEIAEAHRESRAHLVIAQPLGLNGWVETVRGIGGGMRLAGHLGEINLGAIVRSIEPDFSLVECFAPGSTCAFTCHCALSGVVQGALQDFMQHIDEIGRASCRERVL